AAPRDPAGVPSASEHGAEADQDLIRSAAVAVRIHGRAAGLHIARQDEFVLDARAILDAQLAHVARHHLPPNARPRPRERDARVAVLGAVVRMTSVPSNARPNPAILPQSPMGNEPIR